MATVTPGQPRKPQSAGFLGTMARHPELCCFIFALVFTAFSKYTRSASRPMVTTQPPPHRFFPSTSPVRDFPYGNIYDVGDLLIEEEFIVVMYYAPWCGKSMEAKEEFDKAARYMAGEVLFVGINCWYPAGSCRQQNNFVSYPVLYVYQTQLDGYKYSGVLSAEYLLRFVQQIMYPLTYIHNQAILADFIASKDNVLVGYFDFHSSPQPPGFLQFFYASRRIIEKEPNDVILCGLITNHTLASTFNMNRQKTVFLLRTLNETLKYPVTANFTSSALTTWVQSHRRHPLTKWLLPSGTKSLQVSNEINRGPAIIIFTPEYPLSKVNQIFHMLREMAMDYNNCNSTASINQAIHLSKNLRLKSLTKRLELLTRCQTIKEAMKEPMPAGIPMMNNYELFLKRCCLSLSSAQESGCDLCIHYHPGHPFSSQRCRLLSLPQLESISSQPLPSSLPSHCMEFMPNYNANEYLSLCCSGQPPLSRPPVQKHIPHTDPFIHAVTSQRWTKECAQLRLQKLYGWLSGMNKGNFLDGHEKQFKDNFTGLGCHTNRTVNFYLMNSRLSYMFADSLELDLNPAANKTALVLIDNKNEVHYLMQEEFSKKHLESFIKNYTDDMLSRYLRTTQPVQPTCLGSHIDVCVREVSTQTFKDIVMEEDKDVVLLHYAPWCGFCAGLAHIYLSLARYFRSAKGIIFARINSDRNDLPWEFMVDSYPAVQFFPAYRKEESVSFPDHLTKTLPNLIQFVLHYATHSLRLETGFSICSRTCIKNNLHSVTDAIHHLHSEIRKKSNQLSHLKNYINKFISLIEKNTSTDGNVQDSVKSLNVRLKWLEDIQQMLKSEIFHKELQLQNARQLHSALLSTQGYFIEQHKLTAIIKRYDRYRSLLTAGTEGGKSDEEGECSDTSTHQSVPDTVEEAESLDEL